MTALAAILAAWLAFERASVALVCLAVVGGFCALLGVAVVGALWWQGWNFQPDDGEL